MEEVPSKEVTQCGAISQRAGGLSPAASLVLQDNEGC